MSMLLYVHIQYGIYIYCTFFTHLHYRKIGTSKISKVQPLGILIMTVMITGITVMVVCYVLRIQLRKSLSHYFVFMPAQITPRWWVCMKRGTSSSDDLLYFHIDGPTEHDTHLSATYLVPNLSLYACTKYKWYKYKFILDHCVFIEFIDFFFHVFLIFVCVT